MPVIAITNESEFEQHVQATKGSTVLLLVDYSASWCGPCRMMEPRLEAMATTYSTVVFIKVDVDALPGLAAKGSVSAMPTFHLYKNGEKVGEVVGANPDAVTNLITKNL